MNRELLFSFILTLLLASTQVFAQDRTISGRVTDDSGQPIPGATVIVKGNTSINTVTGDDGRYSLIVPDGATIIISFLGQQKEEVVGNRTTIDVGLADKQLKEVVVTGVGEAIDRSRLGIAVESVNATDFTNAPSASIDQALLGKIPGAQITSITGQPGQQQNIILRGINSLGTNQPMIMVDGIQINVDNNFNGSDNNLSSRLADLDLSNIERVEVVQGAAAATIYGAQGANGVIQIFTKRGKVGKPEITISSTVGVDNVLRGNLKIADRHYYDVDADGRILTTGGEPMGFNVNSWNFPAPAGQANSNSATGVVDKPFVEQTFDPLNRAFRRDAITTNNSVNISGGNGSITYAASLANLNQQSVILGTLNRTSARLNLGTELFKNFTINYGVNYINSNNTTGGITGQNNVNSPLGSALLTRQFVDVNVRDDLGNLIGFVDGANANSVNPRYAFENVLYDANVNRIINNFNANYKINKFFELDYKFGSDYYRYDYQDLIKNQTDFRSPARAPFEGRIQRLEDRGNTQNSLASLFFRTNLAEDFGVGSPIRLSTQLAFDWRKNTFDRVQAQVTGIPAGEPNFNLTRGNDPFISQFQEEFVTYGFLANQRFEYGTIFGLSGGLRVDWSSAFGRGSEPFVFPRGDVYVNLSELNFWDGLSSSVPEFKLRAAYGAAGIQPGAFDRIQTLTASTVSGQAFLTPRNQLRNPNLGVQVSREFEVGSDFGVSLSKGNWFSYINTSFTYWTRRSEDVIRLLDIPPSTGASTILDNGVTLASQGFQLSLNMTVFDSPDVTWNFITNVGRGITTVESISNGRDIILSAAGSGGFVLREGERVGTMFGFTPLTSIDQTRSNGTRYIPEASAGDFEIVNGKVVNTGTKQVRFTDEQNVIGDANPEAIFNFINQFQIKKFINISFQIDWIYGTQNYNQTRQWMYRDLVHGDVTNPVTIGGESRPWAAYYTSQYLVNQPNSLFVEDASFVRLRDVSIGVDLNRFFKISAIKRMNLTLSGRNLLTISNYKGLDPEAAANLNDPSLRGLDLYAFPNFRSYNVGLNLTF